MTGRVLATILGALPATALGVIAFMGVAAGFQGFTRDKAGASLFVVWGGLGVAGVAGLWLAALGRDSTSATVLTVCGLIAATPLVASGVMVASAGELSWPLAAVLPFSVGVVHLVRTLHRRRLWRATGH